MEIVRLIVGVDGVSDTVRMGVFCLAWYRSASHHGRLCIVVGEVMMVGVVEGNRIAGALMWGGVEEFLARSMGREGSMRTSSESPQRWVCCPIFVNDADRLPSRALIVEECDAHGVGNRGS